MSTTIDQQVVEMRFDNRNFEKNVSTTMSTLDKLKARLNLGGASKGFEDINRAADKLNLSGIGQGVEAVSVKFSALQVAATTALANITNSAIETGKRLVSSLTVDQIAAGWSKYEQKTSSVQTIMNATGKSIGEINEYLNKLMWFSDETSYSFTDMTAGLATMVSSGGDIDKLIPLITGVANATAFAGKGAAEFSRVLQYGINQAYSLGYMQVMDWKTIEGATVNSKQLMETLIAAAEAMGKIEKGQVTVQNFRSSLADKWLDTDVMEAGFGRFSELSEAAYKAVQAGQFDTASEAIEALAGDYDELAGKAFRSAQEAKSFTEAIDATKDAVSSGWMKSFEIIFGNYEEAKVLWTDLANLLWDVFASGADKRNEMLENVFGSNWDKLVKQINAAGHETEDFEDSLRDALKAGGHDVEKLVSECGSLEKVFTSGAVGSDILKAAIEALNGSIGKTNEEFADLSGIDKTLGFGSIGDDVKKVQEHLEALGYTLKNFGADGNIGAETVAAIKQFQSDNNLKIDGIIGPETITALEEAAAATQDLNSDTRELITSYDELAESVSKPTGRQLFIESLAKIAEKLTPVLDAIKEAWGNVFGELPSGEEVLSGMISKIAEFADSFEITASKIDNIKSALEGLFRFGETALIASSGIFSYLNKIVKVVATELGVDFWNTAGNIGRFIVQLRNWLVKDNAILDAFRAIGDSALEGISNGIVAVKEWIDAFLSLNTVSRAADKFITAFSSFASNVGGQVRPLIDIFSNFLKSITSIESLTFENALRVFGEFFTGITTWCEKTFSLTEKPLERFISLVSIVLAELSNVGGTSDDLDKKFAVIKNAITSVIDPIVAVVRKLIELGKTFAAWVTSLKDAEDIPKAIGEGIGRAIGTILVNIIDFIPKLTQAFKDGMTGVGTDGIAGLVNGLVTGIKSVAEILWTIGSTMISTIMEVLDEHSPSKVMMMIGAFAIIGLVMGLTKAAPELWSTIATIGNDIFKNISTAIVNVLNFVKGINFGQVLAFALSAGVVAFTVSVVKVALRIANVIADLGEAFVGIGSGVKKLIGNINGVVDAFKDKLKANTFVTYADAIKSLGIAVALFAGSVALLAILGKKYDLWPAFGVVAAIVGLLAAFVGVITLCEKFGKVSAVNFGTMALGVLGIGAAIGIMAAAAVKLGEVPTEKLGAVISGLVAFIISTIGMMTLFGTFPWPQATENIDKLGGVLLSMGVLMLAMALSAKMLGSLDAGQMKQCVTAVAAFGAIIAVLIATTKLAGDNIKDQGNALLKIGGVFLMMAGITAILASIDEAALKNGVKAVMTLAGVVVGVTFLMRLINLIPKKSSGESGGGKLQGIALTILMIAGSLLMVAAAIALLGSVEEWTQLIAPIIAIGGLGTGIFFMIKGLSKIQDSDLKGIGTTLLLVAATIGILAIAMLAIASIDNFWGWLGAVVAIGAFGAGIYFMIQGLSKIEAKELKNIGVTLLLVAGAIGILAVVASVIGLVPMHKLMHGLVIVGILTLLMTGIIKATAQAADAKGSLIALAVIIGLLGATLIALSLIAGGDAGIWPVVVAAGAIAAVMGVLCGVLAVTKKVQGDMKVLLSLAGILLVVGGTLAILGSLEPGRAIEAAGALTLAIVAMTAAVLVIDKFGGSSNAAQVYQSVTLLAGMAAVALAIGIAIGIIGAIDEGKVWRAFGVLSATMAVMTVLTILMGKLGSGGSVGSLLAMSVAMLAVAAAIFVIASAPVESLWTAFGVLALSMTVLAVIAIGLAAAFMALAPGAAVLAGVLLSIAAVAVGVGLGIYLIAAAVALVSSHLPTLANGLVALIEGLQVSAGEALKFMAVATVVGIGLLFLGIGVAVLGVGVVALGVGLILVATAFSICHAALGATGEVLPTVAAAFVNFMEIVSACSAKAWDFLITCGSLMLGLIAIAIGSAFATVAIVLISAALVAFSVAIIITAAALLILGAAFEYLGVSITDGLVGGIMSGISSVAEAVGSVVSTIVGTFCELLGINSPSRVAYQIGGYTGDGLALGLDGSKDKVSASAAGLADAAKEGLGTAGAEGGTEFNAEALSNMDITSLLSGGNFDTTAITSMFGTAGGDSGTAFNTELLSSMDLDSLTSSEGFDMSALTGQFGDLGIDSGNAFNTGASDTASMQPTLDNMLSEISNTTPQFTEAGSEVLLAFGDGLKAASATVGAMFVNIVSAMAATSRDGVYNKFYHVGSYLVSGFAYGIKRNQYKAVNAAIAMANAAEEAAKKALDINSPSKVFRKIGSGIPEGFAQGIGMFGSAIDKSVNDMAVGAIDGTKDAISRIADAINTDIDTQPTIRPVLDLSEVASGANAIGGMFGVRPSVKAMANVGEINGMMNMRSQNGVNDGVISAIDKLRSDISNMDRAQYNINGVTYDDGSNVRDAVETIVRYARIERRK